MPNRTLFGQRLHQALTRDDGHPTSVILVDLDDFKTVNDTLGHAVGDRLLSQAPERRAQAHGLRADHSRMLD